MLDGRRQSSKGVGRSNTGFRKMTYAIVFECWYGLCSKHISCDNRPILKSYVLNVNLIVNSRAQHQREQTFDIQNL